MAGRSGDGRPSRPLQAAGRGAEAVFLVLVDRRAFGSWPEALREVGKGAREALGVEPLVVGVSGPEHIGKVRGAVVDARRRGATLLIVIDEGARLLPEVVRAADLTMQAASLVRARPSPGGGVEFRLVSAAPATGGAGPPHPAPQGPFKCPACGLVAPDELPRCPRCGAFSGSPPPSLGTSVLGGPEDLAMHHPSLGEVGVSADLERRLRAAFFGRATAFRVHMLGALAEGEVRRAELRCLPSVGRRASPLPHQVEAARRALFDACGRALMCDPPGTGRAVEVGLVLAELRARRRGGDVLLIAPEALLPCWREELRQKFGLEFRPLSLGEGEPVGKGRFLLPLEALPGPLEGAPLKRKWDAVVVDEAHRLGDRGSPLWGLVFQLEARSLLLLTSRPLRGGDSGLFDLLLLLRPDILAPPAGLPVGFSGSRGEGMLGPEALPEVREALLQTVVWTRAEVAAFSRKVRAVPIRLPDGPARLLERAGEILSAVERGSLPAREAARGLASLHLEGDSLRLKARALAEILRAARGPVVAYVSSEEALSKAASALSEAGVEAAPLDANVKGGGERQVALSADALPPRSRPPQARTVVNLDLPPDPVTLSRRVGRHARQGGHGPVEVVFLCVEGSIEERFLKEAVKGAGLLDLDPWGAEAVLHEAFGDDGLGGLLSLLIRGEEGALGRALLLAKGRVRQEEARSLERLGALLGE